MTSYEHAMIGIDGALAAGLHRRHGWRIVAFAGLAAVLPDWDGLTLLLGARRPMVPWGDVGTTIILVAGMFAMVRRPGRCQAIALVTLSTVIGYIVVRGTCF